MEGRGLVSRRHRRTVPAEAIIDAQCDHIYVLVDPVQRTRNDGVGNRERVVCVAHEQVIVLDAS